MSGVPSGVSVLRHVPQHLIDGFQNGEYRLWGGVLRRTGNPGRGQIVGFLTEGWKLVTQTEQNLPINAEALQSALGNIQMASQLTAGIGVLNLGVQVAGFAMVMYRLERISNQIECVRDELRMVGQNVEWLAKAKMAELRAEALNAIATADRAIRQGDRALLNHAKTLGDRVRRILINLCSDMLSEGRATAQRALFEEFIKLGALVAYAEAQCDEAVEGAGQAADDLAKAARELRRLADGFGDNVRHFEGNALELLRIGTAGRAATKALSVRVDDVVSRVESYVPQLKLQQLFGLDAAGWRALVAPKDSGLLTCVTLENDRYGDLLDFVTMRKEEVSKVWSSE